MNKAIKEEFYYYHGVPVTKFVRDHGHEYILVYDNSRNPIILNKEEVMNYIDWLFEKSNQMF